MFVRPPGRIPGLYGSNVWPCKDKIEWEKVNGPEVLPPVYEKKIGRAPKSRREQPQEVQGKNGPTLSRHGVVIHCKHCSDAGHNSSGCKYKKMGLSTEEAKKISGHNTCYVSIGSWTSCCTGNHKPAGNHKPEEQPHQSGVEARRTDWAHDTSQHNSIKSDDMRGNMH